MYGNQAVDCNGAQIRAVCRQLATVVTVTGDIDESNLARVGETFPAVGSVAEALHEFAISMGERRRLLPLLTKTA